MFFFAFIIHQCVVTALSNNNFGVYTSPTENLLNSMDYLSRKIGHKNLIDVANFNNNLQNKIANTERNFISTQLQRDIKRIEKNPRYIKEIFEC